MVCDCRTARFAINENTSRPVYTTDEMRGLVDALPPASFLRIRSAARAFAGKCKMDWNELYNAAVELALSTRNCPRDVDAAVFLVNTMRSIASAEWERRKKATVVAVGGDRELDQLSSDSELSAEAQVLSDEERQSRLAAVDALFVGDTEAEMVIMGLREGSSPADIRAACGWNDTQYATIRKRMRRAFNDRFGGGWSA